MKRSYVLFALAGCAHAPSRPSPPPDRDSALCSRAEPRPGARCIPVAQAERLLKDEPLEVERAKHTRSGTAGAMTLWLRFPARDLTVKAKWKESARGGSALNNEPRKELAAYQLQKLFLDADEYVVPPTEARCMPLERYTEQVRHTTATFEGTRCVFGVLSYWLENLDTLKGYDKGRFDRDLKYRETIADLNLLTYLVDHRDTRPSNFALSKDKDEPRAFSIDNGLAFSGLWNPRRSFVREWSEIIIPKLPHEKVARLRAITRADLDRLATVAEFAVRDGLMVEIEPTAAFDAAEGIRRKGDVIQLGLTRQEIDGVEARLKHLLSRIDAAEIEVY